MMYRANMGKKLNLDNPQSFNEKLQWLKLYDRRPEWTAMVDKVEAKKIASRIIGDKHIIPTIGVWNSFDDIPLDELPRQFVMKCTHDSGGIVICRDRDAFNAKSAKRTIERSLSRNYYLLSREWPYKNVKPRILVEEYMEDNKTKELRDYKFFCFDGKVKASFIATGRNSGDEVQFDFFDRDFNHLPMKSPHPESEIVLSKPDEYEEMISISEKLSKGIPHIRVDLYLVDGKIYFGEFTFYHWGGMMPFQPDEWDEIFGSWLQLPDRVR